MKSAILTIFLSFFGIASFAQAPQFSLTEVVGGLSYPTKIQFRDTRMFIAEQAGKIKIYKNGALLSTPFIDFSSQVNFGQNEQGFLGFCFEPNYETTGYFYVYYITGSGAGTSRIVRYHVSSNNPDVADPNSAQIVFTLTQPYWNHNGGNIEFGPDGYLYVGLGDGGSGGDPLGNGQNKNSILGKMLRLDVVNQTTYAIPATNPFVGQANTKPEIWAYGLRNPWRWSFDKLNNDLWIADVGQSAWEEVNYISSTSTGGENYGWNCWEGNHSYNSCSNTLTGDIKPVYEYAHSSSLYSITGGYVYRGNLYPQLYGKYICCDYGGSFFTVSPNGNGSFTGKQFTNVKGAVSTFAEDANGELYCATLSGSNGKVWRIAYTCPGNNNNIAGTANNETCINANNGSINITNSNTGTFTYQWSNGATTNNISGLDAGNYTVTATETGTCFYTQNFSISSDNYTSTITLNNSTLSCTAALTYQWFYNGDIVSNEINQTFENITQDGNYYCVTTFADGCTAQSNTINVNTTGNTSGIDENVLFSIFPNPSYQFVTIQSENKTTSTINIYNSLGNLIKQLPNCIFPLNLDISMLAKGVYTIEYQNKQRNTKKYLIKL